MIRENQRILNQLHVLSDGVLVFLSMLAAYWFRFVLLKGTPVFGFTAYIYLGLAAAVLSLITCALLGLYHSYRTIRLDREAQTLLLVTLLDTLILLAAFFFLRLVELSRWMLAFFSVISFGLLLGKRIVLRLLLHRYRRMGYNQKHVLLLGASDAAQRYLNCTRSDRELGYQVDGYLSAYDGGIPDLPRLGGYETLSAQLEALRPDEVVVAVSAEEYALMGDFIAACEKSGTKLSLIPFYAEYIFSNPQVDNVDGIPMINLRRIPLDNVLNAIVKRGMDIIGSALLLVLTSPLLLFAAVGVRLSSPGPVLFRQARMGKHKKTFQMYKFRSMRVNAEEATGWSRDSDPRKTAFGAFLRKFSIDELPQLWNVLRGDMSLVGPRPEVPYYVEQFKEKIPRYMVKHQVRPGITGWAQVNGLRGDTSIEKRIEFDLFYIENWNLFFDLKILLLTLFRLKNREALQAGRETETAGSAGKQ